MALLFGTILLPTLAVFFIAATDWQFGAEHISFVGLNNFAELFHDPVFRASIKNTVLYVCIVVPVTVGLGLTLALLIESCRHFRAFYRAVHFVPYMATLAAMAVVWEALLHPTIGIINQTLHWLGWPAANWLRDEATVLPTLAMIGIWQGLGFSILLFLAGLKAVPQELYDAAQVDGADGILDRLTVVTLPMLGPVMMFVVIVTALRAFEVFDTVRILTEGGPAHASEVLLHTLYVESFEYLRTGYGAAVTIVFLLIVIVLTLLQAKIMDRRVHYS